jgi:hypothetical protein
MYMYVESVDEMQGKTAVDCVQKISVAHLDMQHEIFMYSKLTPKPIICVQTKRNIF